MLPITSCHSSGQTLGISLNQAPALALKLFQKRTGILCQEDGHCRRDGEKGGAVRALLDLHGVTHPRTKWSDLQETYPRDGTGTSPQVNRVIVKPYF